MNITTNYTSCTSFVREEKKEVKVSVQFLPMITSKEELAEQLTKGGLLTHPQVITWFLDRTGLKEKWFLYCRDILINTVRKVYEDRKLIKQQFFCKFFENLHNSLCFSFFYTLQKETTLSFFA